MWWNIYWSFNIFYPQTSEQQWRRAEDFTKGPKSNREVIFMLNFVKYIGVLSYQVE